MTNENQENSVQDVERKSAVYLEGKACAYMDKNYSLTVSLEWHGRDGGKAGDLDFYCFYVNKRGETGKVYYKNMGERGAYPYIYHMGDVTTAGREVILIEKPDELKYLLFAAYSAADNGVGSFYSYNAKVIFENEKDNKVVVPLLEKNANSYWAALAFADCTKGDKIELCSKEQYAPPDEERSPILTAEGEIKMNVGPVEFKGLDLKFNNSI